MSTPEALAALVERHHESIDYETGFCYGCGHLWPCDAARLADEVEEQNRLLALQAKRADIEYAATKRQYERAEASLERERVLTRALNQFDPGGVLISQVLDALESDSIKKQRALAFDSLRDAADLAQEALARAGEEKA